MTTDPKPAEPLSWHYGPTDTDPDPGKAWHYGCGREVMFFDGGAVCGCGAQEAEPAEALPAEPHGMVTCQNDQTPHSLTGDCVNPSPAVWTPGAGLALLRKEHPDWAPTDEALAFADTVLATGGVLETFPVGDGGDYLPRMADRRIPTTLAERERAAYERGKAEGAAAEHDLRARIEAELDRALGGSLADGSGEGIVADVRLLTDRYLVVLGQLEKAQLLLEQAEQYARDLQDGSAPGLAEYDPIRPDSLEHAHQALFDLVEQYGGERLQQQQEMRGDIENAMQELADAGIAEGKRRAVAVIEDHSEVNGEIYRRMILAEAGGGQDGQ